MKINDVLESIDLLQKFYEETGVITVQNMQTVFDAIGINRQVRVEDNTLHAATMVHLAVIKNLLCKGE